MFWNDPNLYGATLPYKDFPVQAPLGFTPFDQFRRVVPQPIGFMPQPFGFLPQTHGFLPPNYGFIPPYYGVPQTFDPMLLPKNINPYVQPLGFQSPLYNFYRPII